jgi:hypothetical protein
VTGDRGGRDRARLRPGRRGGGGRADAGRHRHAGGLRGRAWPRGAGLAPSVAADTMTGWGARSAPHNTSIEEPACARRSDTSRP